LATSGDFHLAIDNHLCVRHGRGQVLGDHYCASSYNNWVPLRTIRAQTSHWVSVGQGTCLANWTVQRADGFAGTTRSQQGMVVSGAGVVRTWGP
jgi:hypothetical protein